MDVAEPTTSACVHRWLIEAPSGGMSRGACKLCGAVRDFPLDPQRRAQYVRLRPR